MLIIFTSLLTPDPPRSPPPPAYIFNSGYLKKKIFKNFTFPSLYVTESSSSH